MPQTFKNLDKAASKILLAAGENAEARIKANTGKQKAKGKIEVDGLYRTDEEKRKLENRAATVKVAIDEMNEKPAQQDAKQEIEDDWLNVYARFAEDKTSEELQSLFGKILAGEIRNPGTFSLRTLQFVSTLSREEAHKISKFCSFAFGGNIVPTPEDLNAEKVPGLRSRILMEELGIASSANPIGGLSFNCQVRPHSKYALIGSGYAIIVSNNADDSLKFAVACQVLTKPGQELIAIANPPKASIEYLKRVAQLVFGKIQMVRDDDLRGGKIVVSVVELLPVRGGVSEGKTVYVASARRA
jgi:hypothetical protein